MRKIAYILTAILLTACNNSTFRPLFYPDIPTEGPLLYQQGFKEGCNTGMTVYGNDIVRAQYSTDVDPEMMTDKTYRNAWKLGNRYCRFHVSQMQMEGTFMKDFGTPVYPNRMTAHDGGVIRERLTDSFWIAQDTPDNLWFNGVDWPLFAIDNDTATFDGQSIGAEGGVFGLLSN